MFFLCDIFVCFYKTRQDFPTNLQLGCSRLSERITEIFVSFVHFDSWKKILLLSSFTYLKLKEFFFNLLFVDCSFAAKGEFRDHYTYGKISGFYHSKCCKTWCSQTVWIGVFCRLVEVLNNHIGFFCQVPMARASIVWLLGEYCERVPKVAPDVLRKMAKTFGSEVRFMMHFAWMATA